MRLKSAPQVPNSAAFNHSVQTIECDVSKADKVLLGKNLTETLLKALFLKVPISHIFEKIR